MQILIVDDHPLLRQAVKRVVELHFEALRVREAKTADEAVQIIRSEPVELAILDIALPDDSGLTVLKRIKQLRPETKCLILTIHSEPQYLKLAMSLGADGYLTKESAPDELREAIHALLAGRRFVTPTLADALDDAGSERVLQPDKLLSVRELEVLTSLAKGRTVSQVAAQLKLSVKTVSTYRIRLLEKLQLDTTAQLIRYAVDQRLVK